MIRIKNLTKIYHSNGIDIKALDNINLNIEKGDIFGIIGPSGAGKSTLIRCINMLEKPTYGSVEIDEVEMTKLSPAELKEMRKKVGIIFQHFNLLSSRTVKGNVAFPLEIAGLDKKTIDSRVKELLELVGLTNKADSYPSQLSGGQKQRVGIARALANNPKVLLCDEATSALDPETTLSILNLLKEINKEFGITIVVVTHEMNVVKQICNKVAVMEKGQIVEQGLLTEIFANPKTRIARNFLRSLTFSELPEELKDKIRNLHRSHLEWKIIKIDFFGEVTAEPILSSIIKKFDMDINVLYGNIDQIQGIPYGTLIVELRGNNEIEGVLRYLRELGLEVEVIDNV